MKDIMQLNSDKVIETIIVLEKRIGDRFPKAGLRNVCNNFLALANQSKSNIEWIAKPNIIMRSFAYFIILVGLGGLAYSITYIDLKIEDTTISNIATISEAVFNDLLLLGAAVFFLGSMESRAKRKRAIKRLNELRVIAHVIDMHQLTKDPSLINREDNTTVNSPKRTLTPLALERYLDYSSEMAALVAKVAALYAQSLSDPVVVSTVNEIEVLCTGLSRKIWQKIMILNEKSKA